MVNTSTPPGGYGWRRLVRHSYHLGGRWLVAGVRHRWSGARAGLQRLIVPLDPWRYYEMSRVLDEEFEGEWLDVSSPKLLMSCLQADRRGAWVGIDLFSREIRAWQQVDPALDLRVQDARALDFPDESFDGCLCVSVIEHLAANDDAIVMAEMWRVLRPGGRVIVTTNIARSSLDVLISDHRYDEASVEVAEGSVFFERHYAYEDLRSRLLNLPWEIDTEEFVRMKNAVVHDWYARFAPASYIAGGALRWVCPSNFARIGTPDELMPGEMGVGYLVLRKPLNAAASRSRSASG
jgi:SAM-dependent methyltransferase